MKFSITRPLAAISILVILPLLGGCCHLCPGGPGKGPGESSVELEPKDPRPIVSVEVADSDEAEILVQELGLEIVQVDGATVYFIERPEARPKLDELGYDVVPRSVYDVYRRVVRTDRAVPEKELMTLGVTVINREKSHLIVEGTLAQLRSLVRAGTRLEPVRDPEPRPRQIRVLVEANEDISRIGAMGVDIYSATPKQRGEIEYNQDQKGRIEIYGGAFDFQIDRLEAAGYRVERLPEPPSGGNAS